MITTNVESFNLDSSQYAATRLPIDKVVDNGTGVLIELSSTDFEGTRPALDIPALDEGAEKERICHCGKGGVEKGCTATDFKMVAGGATAKARARRRDSALVNLTLMTE